MRTRNRSENTDNERHAAKGVSFQALINKIHGQIDSADRLGFFNAIFFRPVFDFFENFSKVEG